MNKYRSLPLGLVALALFLAPVPAHAASDSETLNINATVSARAKLTIAPTTIHFPDSDPDLVASIPATENAVTVVASIRTTAAGACSLTCLASGDLASGTDVIGIDNVSWTGSGSGYSATGTMSSASSQIAGSWTGSGSRSGSFSYFLANSWDYAVGDYSQDVVYTLSAP